jgi:hypothetical protein
LSELASVRCGKRLIPHPCGNTEGDGSEDRKNENDDKQFDQSEAAADGMKILGSVAGFHDCNAWLEFDRNHTALSGGFTLDSFHQSLRKPKGNNASETG